MEVCMGVRARTNTNISERLTYDRVYIIKTSSNIHQSKAPQA
jgi:hypothetical protein